MGTLVATGGETPKLADAGVFLQLAFVDNYPFWVRIPSM